MLSNEGAKFEKQKRKNHVRVYDDDNDRSE